MQFTIEERFRETLPLGRENYLAFVRLVQDLRYRAFLKESRSSAVVNYDRARWFREYSAEEILAGDCYYVDMEYWLSAVKEAKGALKQLAQIYEVAPYYCPNILSRFAEVCKKADCLMAKGYSWEDIRHTPGYHDVLGVGMAYMSADLSDGIYADMKVLGEEK